MQVLKRIFEFYIYANIHVGIATYSLCKITLMTFGLDNEKLALFVFFATIVSYNFIRMIRFRDLKIVKSDFIQNNWAFLVGLNILSFVMLFILTFTLSVNTILALIPFGLCTIFYVLPFDLKKNSNKTLRNLAFFKLFLIGLTWAGVSVLIPLIEAEYAFDKKAMIIFVQRFFIVVAITLPFDIRDLKFDAQKLRTLPQVLGLKRTKQVGLFLLMLFLALEIFKAAEGEASFKVALVVALASLIAILRAKIDQHKYYSAFFVESIPILWYILLII